MDVIFYIATIGIGIYCIGHSFIDSFFKHKEELLTRMYENGKGKV